MENSPDLNNAIILEHFMPQSLKRPMKYTKTESYNIIKYVYYLFIAFYKLKA